MSLKALRSGWITNAITDGDRVFELHDLQYSWVDELDTSDEVYFAATGNGWTWNSLGLQWLEKDLWSGSKSEGNEPAPASL